MSDGPTKDYDRGFNPREYLAQYYSTAELADDDLAIFQFVKETFKWGGRMFSRAIEVGCGPTVHHAFALAPFVCELHLAEYLPGNLDQVKKWLAREQDAHDWDPLLRGVLAVEGGGDNLEARKQLLRRVVTRTLPCDLRRDDPTGAGGDYDLVASFYTAECIGRTTTEWEAYVGRVLALVKPGGEVLFAAVRNSSGYAVLGRTFTVTPVNESDFARVFSDHGFDTTPDTCVGVPITAWVNEGFDSIVLAHGKKRTS